MHPAGYIPRRMLRRQTSFTALRVRMQIGARARNAKRRLHGRARANSRPIVSSRTDPTIVFNDPRVSPFPLTIFATMQLRSLVLNAITNAARSPRHAEIFIAWECVNARVLVFLIK